MFFARSLMLVIFGLGVGTVGTMLGIGGGWIHVPFLMLLFHFSPQMAIGTSIGIIFFNTLAGSIVYYVQKRMDVQLAKRLAAAVVPGALIGPFIVQRFRSSVFFILFAVILLLIAVFLFFRKKRTAAGENIPNRYKMDGLRAPSSAPPMSTVQLGVAGTLIIGFVSNIFGIGGGIIHVPFLILILQIPTHVALGTSHFILCVSSFFGTAVYYLLGDIQVDFMMPVAAGTILGARLGAELARRVDETLIRRALVVLLLFLAIKMAAAGIQGFSESVPIIHDVPGPPYVAVPQYQTLR